MKGLVKILIGVIILQAIMISVGICALFVLQGIRTGAMIIPPNVKQVIEIIACFFINLYLILGTAGWMIFVCLIVGDK